MLEKVVPYPAKIGGAFAIAVGVAVIIGWATGSDALTRVFPARVSMNPLTAFCFLMAGVAAILQYPQKNPDLIHNHGVRAYRVLAFTAATVVFAVGLEIVGSYFFEVPGWDSVLFRDKLFEDYQGIDNRMSFNTSVCFSLLGPALLIRQVCKEIAWLRVSDVMLSGITIIATVSLAAYFVDVIPLAGGYEYVVPMAVHTATAFLLLSLGLLLDPQSPFLSLLRESASARIIFGGFMPLLVLVEVFAAWYSDKLRNSTTLGNEFIDVSLMTLSLAAFWAIGWWSALKLYRSEIERRSFYEMPIGLFCELNEKGEVVRMNQSLRRVLEAPRRNFFERKAKLSEFAHAGGVKIMEALIERTKDTRVATNTMVRMATESGNDLWMLWSMFRIPEGNSIYAAARDVTELRAAQLAIEGMQDNLRTTLESVSDSIILLDAESQIILLNSNAERLLQLASDQAVGRKVGELLQLYDADTLEPFPLPLAQVRERKLPITPAHDIKIRTHESQNLSRETVKFTLAEAKQGASIDGYVMTLSDVTDERRAMRELRRSNQESQRIQMALEVFLDTVPDPVIGADSRGIVTHFNGAAQRLFGWSVGEAVGRNVQVIFGGDAGDLLIEEIKAAEKAPKDSAFYPIQFESTGELIDGSEIPIEITLGAAPIGRGTLWAAVIRDITGRRKLLKDLNDSRSEAEAANQAKSEFLASMSHEIRTPMNGIIGMIDLLERSSLHGPQLEMAGVVRESAEALLQIINGILDFSKIEAGRMELDYHPCVLEDLIGDLGLLLDRVADKSDVELLVYADPKLSESVIADPAHLRQVLSNLLSNAIKFSSKLERLGQVQLRATVKGSDDIREDQYRILFEVIDNGIGLSESEAIRLFQPFVQANSSTRRHFGGTGLGLSICKQLVEMMGGEIKVESEPGLGSRFFFELIVERAPDCEQRPNSAPDLAGLVCVLVGNNQGVTPFIASWLNFSGVTVYPAQALEAASDRLEKHEASECVLIVDAMAQWRSQSDWTALEAILARTGKKAVAVVTERGGRKHPRVKSPQVVTIDGNAMARPRFFEAVAMAAGRSDPLWRVEEVLDNEVRSAPTRDEAIAMGQLILVAEDNRTNQLVIQRQLALLGFACDVADNGREALDRVLSGKYAILLSDCHMPEMDGYELAAAIRSLDSSVRDIPIVALTANVVQGEAEKCVDAGMNAYLSKPVDLDVLGQSLEKFIGSARSPFSPRAEAPKAEPSDDVDVKETNSPVRIEVLEALVGSDGDLISELLSEFVDDAKLVAANIRNAIENSEADLVGDLAHKLKSGAFSMGAHALGEICTVLERAGREGRAQQAAELMPAFDAELSNVIDFIRRNR